MPQHFFTCWVPLLSNTAGRAMLAVRRGTHTLKGFNRPCVAGALPADYALLKGRAAAWSFMWCVPAEVGAGDVVLFNTKLVRAATWNNTARFWLSLDARFACGPHVDAARAALSVSVHDTHHDDESGDVDGEAEQCMSRSAASGSAAAEEEHSDSEEGGDGDSVSATVSVSDSQPRSESDDEAQRSAMRARLWSGGASRTSDSVTVKCSSE
jgi:hypothetical protein